MTKRNMWKFYLPFALFPFALAQTSDCTVEGDAVTIEGWAADVFCIDRGTALDNGNLIMAETPQDHTLHCLVEVSVCIDSGFALFGLDKVGDTHEVVAVLDDAGTQLIVDAGLQKIQQGRKLGLRVTVTGKLSQVTKDFKVAGESKTFQVLTCVTLDAAESLEEVLADEAASTTAAIVPADDTCDIDGVVVTVEGWAADIFCINRGTALDNSNLQMAETPEEHTLHCLVEIPVCVESGYAVFSLDKVGNTREVLYVLDDAGSQLIVDAGEAKLEEGRTTGLRVKLTGKVSQETRTFNVAGESKTFEVLKCVDLDTYETLDEISGVPIRSTSGSNDGYPEGTVGGIVAGVTAVLALLLYTAMSSCVKKRKGTESAETQSSNWGKSQTRNKGESKSSNQGSAERPGKPQISAV
eukprot:m.137777 g.137777  ORF g.137777 m.137777 type:complete len:411 (-) comp14760_c0_seq2:113-1345(-)